MQFRRPALTLWKRAGISPYDEGAKDPAEMLRILGSILAVLPMDRNEGPIDKSHVSVCSIHFCGHCGFVQLGLLAHQVMPNLSLMTVVLAQGSPGNRSTNFVKMRRNASTVASSVSA